MNPALSTGKEYFKLERAGYVIRKEEPGEYERNNRAI